jgi:glycerol uptake facilitator-like aquaporin
MNTTLVRRAGAELLGSVILTGTVIGSGILASRMSAGNDAIALLGNTLATAAILFVLVNALGGISGAHFNPAVTMVVVLQSQLSIPDAIVYALTQVAGCILGAWLAHAMFALPILQIATHPRAGAALILSEGVATYALLLAILFVSRWKPDAVPTAVALVIAAGYWWTASTSFANPAISIARAMSDTFAGVRPVDVPGFVFGQLMGALLAWGTSLVLLPKEKPA